MFSRYARSALKIAPALLALWFSSLAAMAETYRVSGPEALRQALSRDGGGTIILSDGDYGVLELTRPFAHPVVLKAERLHRARFEVIRLNGTARVTLDGLRLSGLAIQAGSERITARNNRITGNLYTRNVRGLTLTDNEVTGGRWGVLLNSVQDFVLRHNKIHKVGEDLMRITGASSGGLIEYNIIADTVARRPTHPDIIQVFHARGAVPKNIKIRRNLLHDPGAGGMVSAQGVFIADAGRGAGNQGFSGFLVEENLINTASANTIFINSGKSSVVIRNNTLMSRSGGGGNIRIVGKDWGDGGPRITGNAFRQFIRDKRAARAPGGNFVYGKTGEARLFSGPGTDWQDYLPLPGSPFDRSGMGAAKFLAELQAARQSGAAGRIRLGPSWLQD